MSKKYHYNVQPKANWEMIISLAIIMITTLGTTIPLYILSSNQIAAIQADVRDFHGKLCAIEERNRK